MDVCHPLSTMAHPLLFLFLNKAVEALSLRIHPHTLMFSDLWEKALL